MSGRGGGTVSDGRSGGGKRSGSDGGRVSGTDGATSGGSGGGSSTRTSGGGTGSGSTGGRSDGSSSSNSAIIVAAVQASASSSGSSGNSNQITPEQAQLVKLTTGIDLSGVVAATDPQASASAASQAQQQSQSAAAAAAAASDAQAQAQAQAVQSAQVAQLQAQIQSQQAAASSQAAADASASASAASQAAAEASQSAQAQAAADASASAASVSASVASVVAAQRSQAAQVQAQSAAARLQVTPPAPDFPTTTLSTITTRTTSPRVDRVAASSAVNKAQDSFDLKTALPDVLPSPLATLAPDPPLPLRQSQVDTAIASSIPLSTSDLDLGASATSLPDSESALSISFTLTSISTTASASAAQSDITLITAAPTGITLRPIATSSSSSSTPSGTETLVPVLLTRPAPAGQLSRGAQSAIISVMTVGMISIILAAFCFLRFRKRKQGRKHDSQSARSDVAEPSRYSASIISRWTAPFWGRLRFPRRENRNWFGLRRNSQPSAYGDKEMSQGQRRRHSLLLHLDLGRQFSLSFNPFRQPRKARNTQNVGLAISTDTPEFGRPESTYPDSMYAERSSIPPDRYDYADLPPVPPLPPIKTGRDGRMLSNITERVDEDAEFDSGIPSYYERPETMSRSFV